ncbi:SPOR domain-containing protein, partial [Burkholderia pseudomallei]
AQDTAAASVRAPAATATADGDASSPASPPGARFALQLGAFRDDATARNWATKLKAAGVPAYVEHRKQADGSTATLLRAGPFADRAAASAAIAKVREAGLTQ